MKRIIFTIVIIHCCLILANGQWVQTSAPESGLINCFAKSGTTIFSGTYLDAGIYLSTNDGLNWTQSNPGLIGVSVSSFVISGTNIFAGTGTTEYNPDGNGILRTTNNGANWSTVNYGLTHLDIYSLAVSGTNFFAGSCCGAFLSTNNGSSWNEIGLTNSLIFSFALSGTNLYAGSAWPGGVFLSTNNGTNWTAAGLANQSIYSLLVSGSNLFAGTNSGIFLSTNNGGNWTAIGLANQNINSILVSGSNLFAGTNSGVFLSTNNGTNWISKNQGFYSSPIINALLISNNYILAGTYYHGIWRRSLSEIIGIQNISSEVPSDYILFQNYPNPFNPATSIKFSIPKSSNVKLVVYDITGKELELLVNEQLKAGTYQTNWNALNYPSGVYFYRLTAGEYSETKRMVLVK
jgi:hypothetical protein